MKYLGKKPPGLRGEGCEPELEEAVVKIARDSVHYRGALLELAEKCKEHGDGLPPTHSQYWYDLAKQALISCGEEGEK